MKLLLITSLDVLYTATAIRTVLHAEAFKSAGHEPTLVFFKEPRRNRDNPIRHQSELTVPYVELSPFNLPANIAVFTKLAAKNDLVFIEKCIPYAVLPALCGAVLSNKPVHHDWIDNEEAFAKEVYRHPFWPFLVGTYERLLPAASDSVSVANRHLQQRARQYKHLTEDKICWVPANTDTQVWKRDEKQREIIRKQLGIEDKTVVFCYLGGLEPGTYVDILIKAMKILDSKFPERKYRLLIIGSGTWQNALESLTKKEKLERTVIFSGRLPQSELNNYLSAADVGLAPYEETLYVIGKSPVKIPEYLSSSLPVIASAVGDCPELVGKAGILVQKLSPEAFAEAMASISKNYAALKELQKTARKRAVENYDYRVTSKPLIEMIERLYS